MASLLDYEPGDCRTAEFRSGFAHGPQALFDVAGGHLSEEHAALWRDWLNRSVRDRTASPGAAEEPLPAPSLLRPI
ncbi:hypothetical protein [Methylobacterium oxalidis]|uniref:hypothetical protein n=1 Tax=Methylobacterium oxalidis TaxID=944322 RepID=UPI00331498D2